MKKGVIDVSALKIIVGLIIIGVIAGILIWMAIHLIKGDIGKKIGETIETITKPLKEILGKIFPGVSAGGDGDKNGDDGDVIPQTLILRIVDSKQDLRFIRDAQIGATTYYFKAVKSSNLNAVNIHAGTSSTTMTSEYHTMTQGTDTCTTSARTPPLPICIKLVTKTPTTAEIEVRGS